MAPSGRQRFVERREPEGAQERILRCSYFLQCAFYKDESPHCTDQPASCPKWREHLSGSHEVSDF